MPPLRCKAGVRDVGNLAVTIGDVIGIRYKHRADRVKQIRADGIIFENRIYQVIHGQKILLFSINPDAVCNFRPIIIGGSSLGQPIKAPACLAVFEDDEFALFFFGPLVERYLGSKRTDKGARLSPQ